VAQFTRFKPTRDAFLFGWGVLGEDFLGVGAPSAPPAPGGGGFAEPMPDEFFLRYKPTLRMQR